ncbi:uncharacterized membrane-anchored protein YjiN (DUF445 family) [Ruminiclostridium sufflavum DSM 19573]|uniref:Uncharacterized membrane-anchored protein YjiN (DUF445 family) n=1 Tax=Ruminiclostridium sufflavum DSM 19573 TaxID=1121337 RepID=A0A318XMQ9_9FIRM|nr:DUF445 domain-containing protein [Ruminiclostridium sufflavum]PYG87849.1 uncharacterized membrane-anchored protein YjiN (DUF445 family) [Ruminiclostridium sufflavum DSM 19573]
MDMDNSYKSEEEKLRKKLRSMRIIATSLLILMAVVFIIFRRYEDRGLFFSSVAAFAEASMVGALADWFAVVALFRHPLGLRIIPHTAIIQNNKQRIAKALSNFVVSNFFTPEIIKAKLDKINISERISGYIRQNKAAIAKAVSSRLPAIIDSVADDNKLEEYIKRQLSLKIEKLKLYPVLAEVLKPALEAGYHKPIVKGLLNSTYNFIGENKDKTMLVLGGINKTLTMPFIGDIIYRKILEFLYTQADELDTNEEVEVNKLLLSALPKLLDDMQNSQELIEKGELLKSQLLNSELYCELQDRLVNAVIDLKSSVMSDEGRLTERLSSILDRLVAEINDNNTLQGSIDIAVTDVIEGVVSQYGNKVGELIYDTMEGWETNSMVEKIEVQVGADLQYIRINGTVIGGLAGLAIHLLTVFFF